MALVLLSQVLFILTNLPTTITIERKKKFLSFLQTTSNLSVGNTAALYFVVTMQGKEIRILSLLALDTIFFFIEIIIGYTVNSLALVADSFHMLNDIFSLIVALWAVKVAKSRGVDSKYTYGWQRAEILGALINAVFLIALCMTIFLEAIQRFIEVPEITNPKLILIVGCAGLASNVVGLVLFHEHGHSHSHGGSAGIEDEENGHSHSHENEHSHSHETQAAVDINYHRRLIDDNAPIAQALPSSYVNRISERTGLLEAQNATYSALNSDSESERHPDPEPFVENASVKPSRQARSHSVSSITHQGHFHAKAKEQLQQKSLNMEGVFLHVMGDALGNIGVIVTALFIWQTEYSWKFYMDPVISLVITAIIFSSALPLCRRTSAILLQGVPQSVDADEVRDDIVSLPGVIDIHDLHIWILSETLNVATLHVSVSASPEEFMKLAKRIRTCMRGHGIASTTIQPEFQVAPVHSGRSNRSPSPEGTPECVLQGNKSSGGLKKANV